MKSVFYFSLFTLSFFTSPARAQDAFYIYRNDGDFNGFFFDEVVRMGYSKIDPQGVEHEEYVIQEIETADSLYRIPLCAIDSIGFQQPKIKINPKVRIIERCGLKPYLTKVETDDGGIVLQFTGVPADQKPKVDDILISVESKMSEINQQKGFSCVVENVQTQGSTVIARGHYVTDPGEVFEQFITVENITATPDGNVKRRLAGWDPEKVKRNEQGNIPDFYLIDKTMNISKEWEAGSHGKAGINAEIGVKLKMRATYDIGLTHFYVKLNNDLYGYVEPSLTFSISGDFLDKSIDDLITLPEIIFPAACPIFGVDPFPTFFLKAGGEISASLTLPKAEMAIVQEITFDSDQDFPISCDIHRDSKENPLGGDLLNIKNVRSNVKFTGSAQAGIRLGCSIGMAGWLQKIIKGNVGLYANIGSKVTAQLEIQSNWFKNEGLSENVYDWLHAAEIDISKLVVGIEAKAVARLLWGEPAEKTFLSKSWEFFCDTLHLVPDFLDTRARFDSTSLAVKATVFPRGNVLSELGLGISVVPAYETTLQKKTNMSTKKYGTGDPTYAYASDFKDVPPGLYRVMPVLKWDTFDIPVETKAVDLLVPPVLEVSQDTVQVSKEAKQIKLSVKTNCRDIEIQDNDQWANATISEPDEGDPSTRTLTVDVAANNSVLQRSSDIILSATEDGETVFDTLCVKQKSTLPDRVNVTFFQLRPHMHIKNSFRSYSYNNLNGEWENRENTPSEDDGEICPFPGSFNYLEATCEPSADGNNLIISCSVDLSENPGSHPESWTATSDAGEEAHKIIYTYRYSGTLNMTIDLSKKKQARLSHFQAVVNRHLDQRDTWYWKTWRYPDGAAPYLEVETSGYDTQQEDARYFLGWDIHPGNYEYDPTPTFTHYDADDEPVTGFTFDINGFGEWAEATTSFKSHVANEKTWPEGGLRDFNETTQESYGALVPDGSGWGRIIISW